jgi:hypothetical protein
MGRRRKAMPAASWWSGALAQRDRLEWSVALAQRDQLK